MAKHEQDRRYIEDELREEGPLEAVKDDAKKASPSDSSDEQQDDQDPSREDETARGSEGHQYLEDELRDEGPMEAIKDDAKTAKDAVTPDSDKS